MIVPVRAFVFALTLLPIYAQQSAPFVPLDGVTNSASYAPACAPDGGVAPGSLFAIFGRDIGPPALTQVG